MKFKDYLKSSHHQSSEQIDPKNGFKQLSRNRFIK